MQPTPTTDQAFTLEDQLNRIVDKMLEPYGKKRPRSEFRNALAGPQYPFDISKPNQHDSKAEFQLEYDAVNAGIVHTKGLLEALFPQSEVDAVTKTRDRLRSIINSKMKVRAPRSNLNESLNLVRKNVSDVGAYPASIFVLLDLQNVLLDRLQELDSQKEQFWNLPHRAPDYYARAIALRLGQLFASETGTRPTYGTSGETGEPSTTYMRALRDVFAALEIHNQERGYAEWAVQQISEEDLKPVQSGMMKGLLGFSELPISEGLAAAVSVEPPSEKPETSEG